METTETELIQELRAAGAATTFEAAGQRGALDPAIRTMLPGSTLAGTALTVRCHPRDNLAVHVAVSAATPGDVLVIDGSSLAIGYLGDILALAAIERGVAGAIIDGGVRDLPMLEQLGFPVWARTPAVRAANKRRPGGVGEPVSCGGVLIELGDVIVADADGVVCVRQSELEQTARNAEARRLAESELCARIRAGELTVDLLNLRQWLAPTASR